MPPRWHLSIIWALTVTLCAVSLKFLAFIGAGVILKVFGLFPGFKSHERPAEGEALISDEAFDRFFMALGSGKTTLCVVIAFALLCALFFLVMWRSHERREP